MKKYLIKITFIFEFIKSYISTNKRFPGNIYLTQKLKIFLKNFMAKSMQISNKPSW